MSEDFNRHFTGVKPNKVYRNYPDMVDNIQQNDHRSNSEYAEVQDQLRQSQFELVDDDQPIDYSMSMSYHHQVRTDLGFTCNNLTIRRTSRCRSGFARNGILPYSARSYLDDQQRATRSDLIHPVAQYPHESVSDSIATNGKFMENNNKFISKMFNDCFSTMAVMANGGILNCTSPSDAGSSSQTQPRYATSHRENRSNLRLENVSYHEDNGHPEETQIANIRRGRRNKNGKKKKGIPLKRSQRLLDMTTKNGEGSQNAVEAEVVPPKKSKKDVNQEFEVSSNSSSSDDNLLEAAPRKICLSKISVLIESPTLTPKRPSNYTRQRKSKLLMKK
ncbi:hypothetical protein HA402_001672 [Bradysia odoriphaga]|nr:hypothetical protein HA402_001672 [Bradysia odoriphaga]